MSTLKEGAAKAPQITEHGAVVNPRRGSRIRRPLINTDRQRQHSTQDPKVQDDALVATSDRGADQSPAPRLKPVGARSEFRICWAIVKGAGSSHGRAQSVADQGTHRPNCYVDPRTNSLGCSTARFSRESHRLPPEQYWCAILIAEAYEATAGCVGRDRLRLGPVGYGLSVNEPNVIRRP